MIYRKTPPSLRLEGTLARRRCGGRRQATAPCCNRRVIRACALQLRALRQTRFGRCYFEGSCQCGKVRFRLRSAHPYPFNVCYCEICRKTAGAGGFRDQPQRRLRHARGRGPRTHHDLPREGSRRRIRRDAHRAAGNATSCSICGSMLWLWAPDWPELIHTVRIRRRQRPLTGACRRKRTHLMLGSKAALGRHARRSAGQVLRALSVRIDRGLAISVWASSGPIDGKCRRGSRHHPASGGQWRKSPPPTCRETT